jgi:hypothetical protein
MSRNFTTVKLDGKTYALRKSGPDSWSFSLIGYTGEPQAFRAWRQGKGFLPFGYRRNSDPEGVCLEQCRSLKEVVQCALETAYV